MENKSKLSVSIVTYNDALKVKALLSSLQKYEDISKLNIYIVDNASQDDITDVLSPEFSGLHIIKNNTNVGFGAAHNQVLSLVNSKYHLILNPDILFEEDTLTKLCAYLDDHPDVVLVTPRVLNADGTEQHLPKKLPKLKYMLAGKIPFMKKMRQEYTCADMDIKEPTDITFCTGCFMLVRTNALKKLNGFDPRYFMYMEDADLSRQLRAYGRLIFYPLTHIVHLWKRSSHKKMKFLCIHTQSMLKYFWKFK